MLWFLQVYIHAYMSCLDSWYTYTTTHALCHWPPQRLISQSAQSVFRQRLRQHNTQHHLHTCPAGARPIIQFHHLFGPSPLWSHATLEQAVWVLKLVFGFMCLMATHCCGCSTLQDLKMSVIQAGMFSGLSSLEYLYVSRPDFCPQTDKSNLVLGLKHEE